MPNDNINPPGDVAAGARALAAEIEDRSARAHAIVTEITENIRGRSGIGNELDAIDEETREDMFDEWRAIVLKHLPDGRR